MDKVMPKNANIESKFIQSICCLANHQEISKLKISVMKLEVDHFCTRGFRLIFETIKELIDSKVDVTDEALCHELEKKQVLEELGGDFNIIDLFNSKATVTNLEYLIKELKELKFRRDLITHSYNLMDKSYELNIPINDLKHDAGELNAVSKQKLTVEKKDISDSIKDVIKLVDGKNEEQFIVKLGMKELDDEITLLRKQTMVLGARSGMGKTALALTCMINQARLKINTIYFCGESSAVELTTRITCILSGFSFTDLIDGTVKRNKANLARLANALQILQEDLSPYMTIYGKGDYEHSAIGIEEIFRIESLTKQYDCAYYDYLQNLSNPKDITDETKAISSNIASIDEISTTNNVLGICMAQLNRDAKDGKPRFFNLRGSSAIENFAHVIAFIHRENNVDMSQTTLPVRFYSDKTRIISPFDIQLGFNQHNAEFVSLPKYDSSYNPR